MHPGVREHGEREVRRGIAERDGRARIRHGHRRRIASAPVAVRRGARLVRYASRVSRHRRSPVPFLAAASLLVVVCAASVGALLAGDEEQRAAPGIERAHQGTGAHHARAVASAHATPARHAAVAVVSARPAGTKDVPILMYHVLGTPAARSQLRSSG